MIQSSQPDEPPVVTHETDNSHTRDTHDTRDAHDTKHKFSTVCRYFRRGTCKHGLRGNDCRFTHRQVCKKFTQHGSRQPNGCNLGKKCQRFHPLMCLDSLRKSECFNEKCTYNHIKGTRRQPPLIRNNQQKQDATLDDKQSPEENLNTEPAVARDNQPDNFLEMIRLMKAELITAMNTQIAALTTQVRGIQQMQSQQTLMPMHQTTFQPHPQNVMPRQQLPVPIQMNAYAQQTIPQAPQVPQGAFQMIRQIQPPTQIQVHH